MDPQNEVSLIIEVLKKQLKLQGITYKDAADKLGLSEVSIKRIFSSYECTITRLSLLCQLANSSLLEISELVRLESESVNYFLTTKQEAYFVKKPFNFHIFRLLYRGATSEELSSKFSLKNKDIFKILRDLERLGLLELHPHNKVVFKISGKIRLRLNGVLFDRLIKKQNSQFLERVYLEYEREDCCLQSSEIQLSKRSIKDFVDEINNLGKKYRKISFHEEKFLKKNELFDVRWLMAFMPYESDWQQYR